MENCIEVNGNDREVHRSVMEELERVCGEKGIDIVVTHENTDIAAYYECVDRVFVDVAATPKTIYGILDMIKKEG